MKKHFWTSDLAELIIDGLISVLFTLGIIAPLFYTRMLETTWLAGTAGCLLAVMLVVLLSRRWWIVPGLILLIGLPGAWILARLDRKSTSLNSSHRIRTRIPSSA